MNLNKRPPGVVLGTLLVVGIVFARAWNASDEYSVAGDRAGLVLMPLGALLTLIGAPMLGVRTSRDVRLRRAERALRAVESLP